MDRVWFFAAGRAACSFSMQITSAGNVCGRRREYAGGGKKS